MISFFTFLNCIFSLALAMGYEKNMSFLVIAKSPKVWKKVEKIGPGSFKMSKKQMNTTALCVSMYLEVNKG